MATRLSTVEKKKHINSHRIPTYTLSASFRSTRTHTFSWNDLEKCLSPVALQTATSYSNFGTRAFHHMPGTLTPANSPEGCVCAHGRSVPGLNYAVACTMRNCCDATETSSTTAPSVAHRQPSVTGVCDRSQYARSLPAYGSRRMFSTTLSVVWRADFGANTYDAHELSVCNGHACDPHPVSAPVCA